MPCYHPLRAFIGPGDGNKRRVRFRFFLGSEETRLPCGQCIGCRLDYSRDWAMRLMHELQLHPYAWFLTMTYREVPEDGSVHKEHVQLFNKRVREAFFRGTDQGFRFFAVGEYGEQTWRPHYHGIYFGLPLSDLVLYKETPGGKLYNSPQMEKLWGHGYLTVSPVSWEACAYVARYVTKKVNGERKDDHYRRVNPATGEVTWLTPEFALMSRRPGLGKGWFDRYQEDVYPDDFVVVGGRKRGPPPRFYDKKLEAVDLDLFQLVKEARLERAQSEKVQANSTPARLAVRETVAQARLNLRKRDL